MREITELAYKPFVSCVRLNDRKFIHKDSHNDMLQSSHMPKFFLLLSMILLGTLAGCKTEPPGPTTPDPGIFELNVLARVGGQVFEKDTEFENILGQRYSLEGFRVYLSDLTLVREDGTDTLIAETLLLDFAEEEVRKTTHGEGLYGQFTVPAGKYKGVRFGIGVPEERNHVDPTDFPADHPLSVSQGMHWNWTSGYIFVKMDGRIDSSAAGTGPLTQGIAYHTGTDQFVSGNGLYRFRTRL